MGRLENKVVLITGAGKGQGAYEAEVFASEGASVILADVDIQACNAVQKEIEYRQGNASSICLDVTSESEWQTCIMEIDKMYGRLDVLVNNAGIYSRVPIIDSSLNEFQHIIDVNLKGVFLGTKYSIPLMKKVGSGSIVNISSTAGLVGNQGGGAYGASKGGVRLLTKYTAIQHAKDKIRANSVHPGPIDTDMIADNLSTKEGRAASISKIPLGRIGNSKDVAMAVMFLASDESSFITGSEIVVDGGLTAQ